jgi:hypothetical protein
VAVDGKGIAGVLNVLVRTKRIIQYMTRTGQKTGTSKISNQLHTKAMTMARVAQYQNLNSGWEDADRAVLHRVVGRLVGIKLWLQEGEEEVEQVDAEGVRDCERFHLD